MGSPLSPILAEIVMQAIERTVFDTLRFQPKFFSRYVDDAIGISTLKEMIEILQSFNSQQESVQFTCEREKDGKINFLEMTITRVDKHITCDWSTKPLNSGRFLNYYSHHAFHQKIGIIIHLIDKILLLEHDTNKTTVHIKNITNILIKNSYPLDLIKQTISKRCDKYMRETTKQNSDLEATNNNNNNKLVVRKKRRKKQVIALPYIGHFSENILKVFQDTNFHCVFSNKSKTDFLFADKKDKIEKLEGINSVYMIPCKNCTKVYIGQTKHKLRLRLAQHLSLTYKKNKNCTALVKHCRSVALN